MPPDNNYKLQFKSVNVKALNLKIFRVHSQNLGFLFRKMHYKTWKKMIIPAIAVIDIRIKIV